MGTGELRSRGTAGRPAGARQGGGGGGGAELTGPRHCSQKKEEGAEAEAPKPLFGGAAAGGFAGFAAAAGSGGGFGTGGGFGGGGGFGAPAGSAAAPAAGGESSGGGGAADAEAECKAEFKPLVELDKVEADTGEEEEAILMDWKAKLFRFDSDAGEWKERGLGQCRILQHKGNKKTRMLMRRDKTLKICANHVIMPGTQITNHDGNEKALVWSTPDFAEEELVNEVFCIKFGNKERADDFKQKMEEAMERNEKLLAEDEAAEAAEGDAPTEKDEGEKEVDALADALGGAKVEEGEGGGAEPSSD